MSLKQKIASNRLMMLFIKAVRYLIKKGPLFVLAQIRNKIIFRIKKYTRKYGVLSKKEIKYQKGYSFDKDTKFSILVPLYNTPIKYLKDMIDSVLEQTYSNWELCLADASDKNTEEISTICKSYCDKDSRIKYKKIENKSIPENTNVCCDMSTGDYIVLFDHDDILSKGALFEIAKVIKDENSDYIYTDEALFTNNIKKPLTVHFKPDFSPDTLRSYNYICHLSAFKRDLFYKVGMFKEEYNGSQDYDLALRLSENAKNIVHIDKVLYFWRVHQNSVSSGADAKPYTIISAKKALKDHLERVGLKGQVMDSKDPSTYKIEYDIIGNPKISILIPNKDHVNDLKVCLNSIYKKSTYQNFEIVMVENNSEEKETFEYYEKIKEQYKNLKVVNYKNKFNYSKINNFGAEYCTGEYILLLNNDVEVLTDNWLEEMLMFAQREDVGAVGCKLYYPDDMIQHGGVIVGLGGVAGHSHKRFDRNSSGYMFRLNIAQNLSACTAACLMMKKSVFHQIGGFDEKFEVAFNDVDLCLRIRKLGKLIVYTPYSELYHYESISRGDEDTPEKIRRFQGEMNRFKDRWEDFLEKGDPYYNSNLTLDREDFSFK